MFKLCNMNIKFQIFKIAFVFHDRTLKWQVLQDQTLYYLAIVPVAQRCVFLNIVNLLRLLCYTSPSIIV